MTFLTVLGVLLVCLVVVTNAIVLATAVYFQVTDRRDRKRLERARRAFYRRVVALTQDELRTPRLRLVQHDRVEETP